MRKSTRALAGLVLMETLLAGGAGWMVAQVRSGAWKTSNQAEAIGAIMRATGAAMGVVGVVLLLAFFFHRRKGEIDGMQSEQQS